MKIAYLLVTMVLVTVSVTALAAPVESVESARATAAFQKVEAFLGEKAVVERMTTLGVTPEQAKTRVARLSDAQLAQLAAQIDLLKAGGTIQGGHPNPYGPIGCVLKCIGETISHIMKVLFCWTDV